MKEVAKIFFQCKNYVIGLTKKWVGLHFWKLFHKLIWSPWLQGKYRHPQKMEKTQQARKKIFQEL
jgi:hypothetical protein